MKNKTKWIICMCLLLLAFTTSCKRKKCNHTHTYEVEWYMDEESHYHQCSCGEKKDIEKHIWDNEKEVVESTEEKKVIYMYDLWQNQKNSKKI